MTRNDGVGIDGSRERRLEAGGYVVRLTAAGTGASGFRGLAVTSGGEYPERHGGVALYVRDLDRGIGWPAALHPDGRRPDGYRAWLEARVPRFVRRDGALETAMEVAVAEDGGVGVELRRLTVTNRGDAPRRVDITSCVPLALDDPAAYAGHPAFSKLFLQTEYLDDLEGLLVRRRPRSPEDDPLSAIHLLVPETADGEPTWETDRFRFLGRGRGPGRPAALDPGASLSGTVGSVLDPVLALRRGATLEPGASIRLTAVVGAGRTPEAARAAVASYAGGVPDAAFERDGDPGEETGGDRLAALEARDGAAGEEGPRTGAGPGTDSFGPAEPGAAPDREELLFFNGYGGFSEEGDEYVIRLGRGVDGLTRPPLPWINVVANSRIGFLASETGAGYTWAGNSRLNRLTPWSNDPVTDPHGEAVYLRDEETGAAWSPLPGPRPGEGDYEARHGFGYSRYRHDGAGLLQETWLLVAREDPVKLVRLRITNRSDRPRRLAAYGYLEWVLGGGAEARARVRAGVDPETGAVLARNPETEDFEDAIAFAAPVGPEVGAADAVTATADRRAFVGGHGTLRAPAAVLAGGELEAAEGVGDGACAAFRVPLEVAPGESVECAFVVGQTRGEAAVRALLERYGDLEAVSAELEAVRGGWRDLLGRVRIETPSPALDLMVNGWLPYQDLSCRVMGRSAFYQSGGAYGYRDQLQDTLGLIHLDPALTRRQILLHAAHQFPEGDVLHWWHPPASRGIRTRFSDDLLWLPFITGVYLDRTGDADILDERTTFVEARPLRDGEDEAYLLPERTERDAPVYEHCCLSLDRSLTRGAHGLPLIGTGDWNDGMNRVGREGRGESVWLGFFLAAILDRWIPLCRERGDDARVARYQDYRTALGRALNAGGGGWDGSWYRRAYYDGGQPIGSSGSDECRIDAIAQAWAVLSRVAPPDRAERALDALEARLVDDDNGLIRLLTPPFDRTPHDPGYIKGYVPGVRENGGQYTHGVLWAVRAMAEAGRSDRAAELLEMLLPVHHGSGEGVERYQVEPYVVAADVYGTPPHVGRGGWTWYTGSAGWLYRIALESILGLEVERGCRLRLRPGLPSSWPGFRIAYRPPGTGAEYRIEVRRGEGEPARATVDGEAVELREGAVVVELVDDGIHDVVITDGPELGRRYAPTEGRDGSG